MLHQRGDSRMTSTLYVALISPALLDTWHVYFPLCSGVRFLRLSVHLFFLPSSPPAPLWSSSSGRLSFSHTMSGRGLPLAVHFSLTELPTGRAMTRFRIFDGWVKRGRTANGGEGERKREKERETTEIRSCSSKMCVKMLLLIHHGRTTLSYEHSKCLNHFLFSLQQELFKSLLLSSDPAPLIPDLFNYAAIKKMHCLNPELRNNENGEEPQTQKTAAYHHCKHTRMTAGDKNQTRHPLTQFLSHKTAS